MDYKSMHAVLWWMLFIFLIFVPGSTLNAIENSDITAAATKIPATIRVPAGADERTTTKAPTQRRDAINDIIRLKPQATTEAAAAAAATTTTNIVSTISTAFSSTTEATATTTTTVNAATLKRNPASSSIFNESELSLNPLPSIKDRTTTAATTTTTATIATTKSVVAATTAEQVTIATEHLSLATSKEFRFNQDDNKIVGSHNNSDNRRSDLKASNKSRNDDSSNSSTNNADNVDNSGQQQQPIESSLKFASYDDINDSNNLNNRLHKLPAAQQLQQQHQLQHYESNLRQHYTRQVQQAHVIIASAMTATTAQAAATINAAAVPRDTNFMVAVAMSENELDAETQVKVFESVAAVATAREATTTIAATSAKATTSPTTTTATFAPATAATPTAPTTAEVTAALTTTTTTTTPATQARRTTRRRSRPTTTPLPTPAIDDYATINSQAGTHAYLPCNVKQLVKKPISWLRVRDGHILTVDQTTFIADQRFQSIYTTNPERWSLQIKYVQLKDAGTYECQVSTEPKASAIVSLRIVEPKTELIGEPTRHVKAGSQVKLRCIISQALEPPLFINWFYNQKQIYLHNRKGWRTEIERIDLPPDTPAPPTPPPAATTQAPLPSSTLLPAAAATSPAASAMTVTLAMAAATSAASDLAMLSVSDANATASMLAAVAAATSTWLPAFASTNAKTTPASAFTTQAATTTTEKTTSMMTTTPLAVTDVKQITTASLIIPAVEKQDSGNYTCSPSNSAPRTVVLHVLNGEYSASAITSGVSGNILIGNKGQQRQQQLRHQRAGLGLGAAVALLCHNVPTILTLLWIIKFLLANNFWNFNSDRNKATNGSSSELEDNSAEITQFANSSSSSSSGNNDNGGKHGTTGNPDTSIRATEIVEPRNMSARECGSNFLQLLSASE